MAIGIISGQKTGVQSVDWVAPDANGNVNTNSLKDTPGSVKTKNIAIDAVTAQELRKGAVSSYFTANVTTGGPWTPSAGGFQTTISVPGILSTDRPIVDVLITSGTVEATEVVLKEYNKILTVTTSNDSISVWVKEKPLVNILLQLLCVRK